MLTREILSLMGRPQLSEAARLLGKWDRNHANAARVAIAGEYADWPVVYEYWPEMAMCSEYMPGRRALLEAADPNDHQSVQAYVDAAFGGLKWRGPWMYMPPDIAQDLLARHDFRLRA